jgi:hypothetical protein
VSTVREDLTKLGMVRSAHTRPLPLQNEVGRNAMCDATPRETGAGAAVAAQRLVVK